jgi:hypothetical protein
MGLILAVVLMAAVPARAQFLGYGGGLGYGGLGYGMGYGGLGMGYGGYGMGYGGLGYGMGYGGLGMGYGGYGMIYPGAYGMGYAGYSGFGYGLAYPGLGYGLAYRGLGYGMNPLYGAGLTPLGMQSALIERSIRRPIMPGYGVQSGTIRIYRAAPDRYVSKDAQRQ